MSINFSFMKITTERLEQVLQELGVKKPDFLSHFNLSKQNYQHWKERGIPGNRLIAICSYLGINLDRLSGKKAKKGADQTFTSNKLDRLDIYELIEEMPDNLMNSVRMAIMYVQDVGGFKVTKQKKKSPQPQLSKQS